METLEDLAARGREGDREALERLVTAIQDRVYGLALRMLWHPEDARDATQEILLRIVTHLSGFRGESAFTTWAYRIAANHLLRFRRTRLEEQRYTFERFGEELDQDLSEASPPATGVEEALLLEEVKIGCTLAMLSCLDRPHRLAYILGEILEMEGPEGAQVLEIGPAAFRKRLERARADVIAFTRAKCGLVESERRCRCRKRVAHALSVGRADPERLLFASDLTRARAFPAVLEGIRRLDALRRAAALYRSHPDPRPPQDFARDLRKLLDAARIG